MEGIAADLVEQLHEDKAVEEEGVVHRGPVHERSVGDAKYGV